MHLGMFELGGDGGEYPSSGELDEGWRKIWKIFLVFSGIRWGFWYIDPKN